MCGDPSRRKVAMTPSGVGKVWARNDSSSAVLMLMISYLSEGWQHARHRRQRATPKTSCTTEQASDGATSFAVPQVRIAARGLLHASAQPLSDNLKWVLGPVPAPACPNTRTRAKAAPHVPPSTQSNSVSAFAGWVPLKVTLLVPPPAGGHVPLVRDSLASTVPLIPPWYHFQPDWKDARPSLRPSIVAQERVTL